jgi:hypothetical protein
VGLIASILKAFKSDKRPSIAPVRPMKRAAVDAPCPAPSFRAVGIVCGPLACRAARDCGRVRWLSAEAPRLPLANCTAESCDCRYRHFQDRRSKARRKSDREHFPRSFSGQEQRQTRNGRRLTDRASER